MPLYGYFSDPMNTRLMIALEYIYEVIHEKIM